MLTPFKPRRFPLYYCPPGVARPAHVFVAGGVRLFEGAGPDGKGGTIYGGSYAPDQASEFVQTPPGWWVRLAGIRPEHLLRTLPLPHAGTVAGALPDHEWLVPALLTPPGAVPEWLLVRGWTPDGPGWVPFHHLADLVERLRAAGHGDLADADLERLAIDLLAVNYHVSEHELIIGQWLTRPMVLAICLAARAITPELRQRLAGG